MRKLTGQREKLLNTDGFVEIMDGTFYSTPRGFALITDRMAEQITARSGQVLLDAEVRGLETQGGGDSDALPGGQP